MLGHVNHARALSLIEDARVGLTTDPAVGDAPMILARLEVDYLRQLYYRPSEPVAVESWVTRLGTASVTLRQDLRQDGHVALSAVAVLVAFDFAADASRPMTDTEREFWQRHRDD